MVNRRSTGNQIRGPHSALTDFLASNNISAAQIHEDYLRRVREAERGAADDAEGPAEADNHEVSAGETTEQKKSRKRKEAAAIQKIKRSKEVARRKARRIGEPDDDDDYHTTTGMLYEKSVPLPGQLENCEICNKRFTVTPYSGTGPKGGLLCPKCSKDLVGDEKRSRDKKKTQRSGRRQNQSNLLDGIAQRGALSLVEICTKKVADNINDIEEFGDLPSSLLRRLSQILSKRRALTSRTLNLFLRPDLESIDLYDCAKLETDDFQKIFSFMPAVSHINLRYAGQMKNQVIEYMIDRSLGIKSLQLDASNLISDACWRRFFEVSGGQLETLKLFNLDFSLDDETVEVISRSCPNLRRLKLEHCWKVCDRSLKAISTMSSLEHLSLNMVQAVEHKTLLDLVYKLGPRLRTLSLEGFPDANDELFESIHNRCRVLTKLRITNNGVCSSSGFTGLFRHWPNSPLEYVDFSGMRDLEDDGPTASNEHVAGLSGEGFAALMEHSGATIRDLNISSCRHVSYAVLDAVFSDEKRYPQLRELDVSFQSAIDDYLVGRIFRCCPAIRKLVTFACFNIQELQVPSGVALIGDPRALGPIATNGQEPQER